jgi:hypothetical protein
MMSAEAGTAFTSAKVAQKRKSTLIARRWHRRSVSRFMIARPADGTPYGTPQPQLAGLLQSSVVNYSHERHFLDDSGLRKSTSFKIACGTILLPEECLL